MRKGPTAQRAEATSYARSFLAFQLSEQMDASDLTQRKLAHRVGVTEGRISQLLGADANPTITTIATIADALGCVVQVRLVPKTEETTCAK